MQILAAIRFQKKMIKLKNISQINKDDISVLKSESFYNRIINNYSIMNEDIEAKDLLHMVTMPSDVFLAEGDTTNIFNQNNTTLNLQKQKIEVLNNLVNRILISHTEGFTYQDSVYITNVLKKLGVNNSQQFMKKVETLINENNNTKEQIDLLTVNVSEFVKEEAKGQRNTKKEKEEGTSIINESPYYIHQDIFNRLDTENIYNEVTSLVFNEASGTEITNNLLLVSEQIRTKERLKLQKLQNEVMDRELPLIYSHENYYEDNILNTENVQNEETITSSLSQAVLLSLVDKVYEIEGAKINSNRNEWYYISNALYESAQNTIERFTQNLSAPISKNVLRNQIEATINNNELLIRTLSTITENEITENILTHVNLVNEGDTAEISEHTSVFESSVDGHDREIYRREIENLSTTNEYLNSNLTFLNEERNEEEILQYLTEINERNITNDIQYRKALDNFRKRANKEKDTDTVKGRERQKKESLMALENPSKLLLSYKEEEAVPLAEKMSESEKEFINELPSDVREYMELVQQAINISKVQGNDTSANVAGLMDDIARVELINREPQSYPDESFDLPTSESQIVKEVVDRVIDPGKNTTSKVNRASTHNTDINFVHKEQETIDSEEIIERLREERVIELNKTNVINETVSTNTVVNKTEIKNEVINELSKENRISGIVAKSMQDQISQLSDQVYSRLERKLANEKRRRGI